MAQIDPVLYNTISQAYAAVEVALSGVAANARSALDGIVDVDTTTYPDSTPSVADADAALEIESALLSPYNAAYIQSLNIATNIASLLDAVRTVNNHVVSNSSFDGTDKEKLDNWINVEMDSYWSSAFLYTNSCPVGWSNLSLDAGYDITDWVLTESISIDLTSDTILQYKMNDNLSNTNIINEYGNDGTAQANTSGLTVSGKINTSLSFNGFSDFIATAALGPPPIFVDGFSFNFWAKPLDGHPSASSLQSFAGVEGTAATNYYNIILDSNGKISFEYKATALTTITTPSEVFTDNVGNDWRMITITAQEVDTNTMNIKLYVDGVFVKTSGNVANDMDSFTTSPHLLYVGANNVSGTPANYYDGDLDNFCIFTKTLSQDDIEFLYNEGSGTEGMSN